MVLLMDKIKAGWVSEAIAEAIVDEDEAERRDGNAVDVWLAYEAECDEANRNDLEAQARFSVGQIVRFRDVRFKITGVHPWPHPDTGFSYRAECLDGYNGFCSVGDWRDLNEGTLTPDGLEF